MNETILISVCACNEKDLHQTVKSALVAAEHPDNLYFDIVTHDFEHINHHLEGLSKNINHMAISYGGPLGVGKTRMYSQILSPKFQTYHLQIDAHMIFERGWDTRLITNYKNIQTKTNIEKVVISSYVAYWYEDCEGQPTLYNGHKINPYEYDYNPDIVNGKIEFRARHSKDHHRSVLAGRIEVDWDKHPNNFIEQHMIVGHYVFGPISMLDDVIQDPRFIFEGEELSYALRLWTRGYRIFSIKDTILLHKNKLGDHPDKKDWRLRENVPDKNKNDALWGSYTDSLIRLKKIVFGEILGYWGAPTMELLDEYQKAAGIDFKEYYSQIDL